MKKLQRTKKKQQFNLKILIQVLFVVTFVSLLITGIVSLKKVFKVSVVECQLEGAHSCPPELSQNLQFLVGQPFFFVDYEQLIGHAELSLPVRLTSLSKKLPQTLRLTFALEPLAYNITTEKASFPVSQTGQVYQQQFDQPGLIQVRLTEGLLTSEIGLDPLLHHSLISIISTCQELKLPLKTITWLDNSTIQLSMENRSEIFVIDAQQPSLELHRLALVLQSSEYQALTQPKQELDLRFKMPVLRTEQ